MAYSQFPTVKIQLPAANPSSKELPVSKGQNTKTVTIIWIDIRPHHLKRGSISLSYCRMLGPEGCSCRTVQGFKMRGRTDFAGHICVHRLVQMGVGQEGMPYFINRRKMLCSARHQGAQGGGGLMW